MPSKREETIATTTEAGEVVIKAKAEVVGAATRKMAEAGSNVEVVVINNSVVIRTTGSVTLISSLSESHRMLAPMRIGVMEVVSGIVEVEDVAVVEAVETVAMLTGTTAATSVADVVAAAIISPTALMSAKMNSDEMAIAVTTTRKIEPTSPTKIKVRPRQHNRPLTLA